MQLIRAELFERKAREFENLLLVVPRTHIAKYYWLLDLVEFHNEVQGHTIWSINRPHFNKDLKKWAKFLGEIRSTIYSHVENDCCFEVEEWYTQELAPEYFTLRLVTRRERFGCNHRCLE